METDCARSGHQEIAAKCSGQWSGQGKQHPNQHISAATGGAQQKKTDLIKSTVEQTAHQNCVWHCAQQRRQDVSPNTHNHVLESKENTTQKDYERECMGQVAFPSFCGPRGHMRGGKQDEEAIKQGGVEISLTYFVCLSTPSHLTRKHSICWMNPFTFHVVAAHIFSYAFSLSCRQSSPTTLSTEQEASNQEGAVGNDYGYLSQGSTRARTRRHGVCGDLSTAISWRTVLMVRGGALRWPTQTWTQEMRSGMLARGRPCFDPVVVVVSPGHAKCTAVIFTSFTSLPLRILPFIKHSPFTFIF